MRPREGLGTDQEYLRESQYRDPTNLNARIALHTKYARAEQPWYRWLVGRITWPDGAEVLEVGCGTGALWANVAPFLPHLRLTVTDLSEGMLAAAERTVSPLAGIEIVETATCDVQELPFEGASFDVAVANHMLYHVPEPRRAVAELARVLRPHGVLLAATNGSRHLDVVAELSRQAFGWSSLDLVGRRFGSSNGADILGSRFGSVEWHQHESTMVCTDPDDVIAHIASSAPHQQATPEQRETLRRAVDARFHQCGGALEITVDSGCFVARLPGQPVAA